MNLTTIGLDIAKNVFQIGAEFASVNEEDNTQTSPLHRLR